MNRNGLNKREISWLLAQEARGAARALREGFAVQVRDSLPVPEGDHEKSPLSLPVLDSLTTLDETMTLLGDLQSRKGSNRRGRLDVAALLYELTPEATINIDAASGTDVFGDEEGVRRMLQLLISDSTSQSTSPSAAPQVHVCRDDDFVRITAELGPDAAHHTALERRWLNRMALRAGGRLEMTGRAIALYLPADGAAAEKELEALREELEQAQELGEAYARELAGILTAAERQAESGRHHEEESSWWGAQRLAESILLSLHSSATPLPNELASALQGAVEAQALRGKTISWGEAQAELTQNEGCFEFESSEPTASLIVPAALPQLIEWLQFEALQLGSMQGSPLHIKHLETEGLEVHLHVAPSCTEPTGRSPSVPWTLLIAFLHDTPHTASSTRLDDGRTRLSLRIRP